MFDHPIDALLYRDLDVRQLGPQVVRAIQQLSAGDFRAADARKLKGTALYRARLDDRNRLLFKFGEHGGRRVLLVLEVVHNHNYARSRFLGGGEASEADFEPVGPGCAAADGSPGAGWQGVEAERLVYLHPASTVLHVLDKPLSFDDAQAAVFATPLPLIVIGSAGSGKTALTLEKLKTLPGHGLYLTRSSFLVENARSLYYAHRYANYGQEVDFLSLAELVETIKVPSGREARWPDFAAWFNRHQGTFKLREPHRVFEEVTGVLTGSAETGPYLAEDEYLALGVRQSIFLGEERRTVYRVFERWLAHLREQGLFDANVAAWERQGLAAERYDFLVIDEVQDVTPVELRLALAALRDKQLALIRMHWAIENGCQWTMDVMLGEDEGHPCQASRASIETVSWLRLIGYNAVSAWRALAPRKDGTPITWARAMETLRDALLAARVTDHGEHSAAVT